MDDNKGQEPAWQDYDESIHHFLRLNQIGLGQGDSCPPLYQIAAFFEEMRLGRTSLLSAKVRQNTDEHVKACNACTALIQELEAAHNFKAGFVLNQNTVTENSVALARENGAEAVPGYLGHYMEESFAQTAAQTEEESEGLFSMVIRLTKDSMKIMHNGLLPAQVFRTEGIALRGASEYPSYTVDQEMPETDEARISYQVYRENEDEVMLTVKLDDALKNDYAYAKLKKDDRVISSLSFNHQNMAVFNQLKSGHYLLELFGKQKFAVKMALV